MSEARCRVRLTVSPGASRSEIVQTEYGPRVRIAAPAREGKANRALVSYLAERLNLPVSRVMLTRGAAGRYKVIEIDGLTEEEALQRLGLQ